MIVQILFHSKNEFSVTQNFCNCKMYLIQLWITMHNTSFNGSTMNDCAPAIAHTTIPNTLKSALKFCYCCNLRGYDWSKQGHHSPKKTSNFLQMRRCIFFLRLNNLQSTRLKEWYHCITNCLMYHGKWFDQWCKFQYNNDEMIDQLIKLFCTKNKCNNG